MTFSLKSLINGLVRRRGPATMVAPGLTVLAYPLRHGDLSDPKLAERLYRATARMLHDHPHIIPVAEEGGRQLILERYFHSDIRLLFADDDFDRDRKFGKGAFVDGVARVVGCRLGTDRRLVGRFLDGRPVTCRGGRHHGPRDTIFVYAGDDVRNTPFAETMYPPLTARWFSSGQDEVPVFVEPLRMTYYDERQSVPIPREKPTGQEFEGQRLRLSGSPHTALPILTRWFRDVDHGHIDVEFDTGCAEGDGSCIRCTLVSAMDGPDGRDVVWRCERADTSGAEYLELAWTVASPSARTVPAPVLPSIAPMVKPGATPQAPLIRASAPDGGRDQPAGAFFTGAFFKGQGNRAQRERAMPLLERDIRSEGADDGCTLLFDGEGAGRLIVHGIALPAVAVGHPSVIKSCELSFDAFGMPLSMSASADVAIEIGTSCERPGVWWRFPGEKWRIVRTGDGHPDRLSLARRLLPAPEGADDYLSHIVVLPHPVELALPAGPAVLGRTSGIAGDGPLAALPRLGFGRLESCGVVRQDGARIPLGSLNLSHNQLVCRPSDEGLHLTLVGQGQVLRFSGAGDRLADCLTLRGERETTVREADRFMVGSFVLSYAS